MANSIIVIGAQWGDEGKGKIIDLLTIKSDAVVRFQGGHNAGHTLVIEGNETILHLIPSGIFNNVDCIIANGVVLHLPTLFEEIDSLKEKGVAIEKNLHISTLCPLILPSHIALDEVKEKNLGSKAIGTTGRGIGPAYEDKIARRAIHLVDLFHEEYFLEKLKELMEFHNFLLVNLYKTKPINVQTVADEWLTYAEQVQPFVTDTTHLLHSINSSDSNILFEGAQGTMLDIDHGTYPFVTSSNTVAGAASTGTGLGPGDFNHVLGIIKAYTTRVGSGPFPSELSDENGEHLGRVGVEFGATTGRARRCGWLDAVAVKKAIINNSISHLCVTKLDVLDGLEEISIAVQYDYKGKVFSSFPSIPSEELKHCKPIYKNFKGWNQSTSGITKIEDLPREAQHFIDAIESIVARKIVLISTGPGREDNIVIEDLFI